MWPFKRKEKMPHDFKLDELLERVRSEVEAQGGFVIIGLNGPKQNGHDTISAAAMLHGISKSKVIFTVAVVMSLKGYSGSEIGFKSPIQAEDLKK